MKKAGNLLKLTVGAALTLAIGFGGSAVSSQSVQAATLQPRVIIGDDDRVQVTDTTVTPYQSITYILANGFIGTGTVVGKNTVITAGHMINAIGEEPSQDLKEVYLSPGRNDDVYPYGKFGIKAIHLMPEYQADPSAETDIAVLTINPNEAGESIGDVVAQMPMKLSNDIAIGTPLTTTGYPGDRVYGTMWTNSGQVGRQTTDIVYYDMDTAGGQSGSPVYNQNGEMVAVHTGSDGDLNYGTKLNDEKYQFILAHLQ